MVASGTVPTECKIWDLRTTKRKCIGWAIYAVSMSSALNTAMHLRQNMDLKISNVHCFPAITF